MKKLDLNKLVKASTGLNNLKTKTDDLDIGKLKNVSVDPLQLKHKVEQTKYERK